MKKRIIVAGTALVIGSFLAGCGEDLTPPSPSPWATMNVTHDVFQRPDGTEITPGANPIPNASNGFDGTSGGCSACLTPAPTPVQ